jgi:hypothetical protein
MTPPPGSVATASSSTHLPHTTGELAGSDHFADAHWTSDSNDSNSVWSAASYWVRRKRAASAVELSS